MEEKKEKNEENGKTDIEKIVVKLDAVFTKGHSEEELNVLRAELKTAINDSKTRSEVHHDYIVTQRFPTNTPQFKTVVEIAKAIMEWRQEKLRAAVK